MQKLFFVIYFALLLLLINPSFSFAEPAANRVSIRLLPEKTALKGGDTVTVGIEETIAKGWHTYWLNPGDSGTTARVKWSGLDGLSSSPIQWPFPKKLPIGPLTNFGYEDKVILLQDLTLPRSLPEGPVKITADIDILVCHDICIPESHQASFTINGDQKASAATIELARTKLPIEQDEKFFKAGVQQDLEDLVLTLSAPTPDDLKKAELSLKPENIDLLPEEWGLITNTEKTKGERKDGTLILHHKRGERALADVKNPAFVLVYEGSQGERRAIRITAKSETPVTTQKGNVQGISLGKAVLSALLGGLILNLMPCVFPVLSMKALSLVQLKDKEARKARIHGLVYTAGIMLSFAAIALVLIALKASGAQIGWGFQLQNPAIILFLAYLFFTLGLNLSGYFEIDFGLSNVGTKLTQKSGVSGSFFTGVLATLVATPCTAPFMGVAVGYALTQPAYISLAVFLSLGLGLALPYLALTFIPALRHILPRPGVWMQTFRQFLAFPMFASACWLVWVLSQQTDHMGVFVGLLGMLAITFGLWLIKVRPKKSRINLLVLLAALIAFGYAVSALFMSHTVQQEAAIHAEDENWKPYTQGAFDAAMRDGHPVFVNMTAAWCITCKVNERVALSTPATRQLFADKGIAYFKGDWTNQNPEITKFLEKYGRSGVPLYVYYGPKDESGSRPDAIVLPQLLTPGLVEKTITP